MIHIFSMNILQNGDDAHIAIATTVYYFEGKITFDHRNSEDQAQDCVLFDYKLSRKRLQIGHVIAIKWKVSPRI